MDFNLKCINLVLAYTNSNFFLMKSKLNLSFLLKIILFKLESERTLETFVHIYI
jgi:hypothetical protein